MKIRVRHEDGSTEILTLFPPLRVTEGDRLDRITDSTEMDYWFTKEGHYDGWGRSIPNLPDDEVDILMREIEGNRAIIKRRGMEP